jgi:LysM repeat protein
MVRRRLKKMKKLSWKTSTLIFGLMLTLGLNACSSSKTKEADETEVIVPALDAGTDAVPQPEIEPPAEAEQALDTPPAIEAPAEPEATPPIPDPAPFQASAADVGSHSEDYTVQAGDTLMKIAFEVYGDIYKWKAIYEANKDKISNPNAIPNGVVLKVEKPATPVAIDRNGEKYLIKKGDTLGKISDTLYGTPSKWKQIWEHNKQLIQDPNRIFAGFYLYYLSKIGQVQKTDSGSHASEGELPHSAASGADHHEASPLDNSNLSGANPTHGGEGLNAQQPPAIPINGEVPSPDSAPPAALMNPPGSAVDAPPPAAQ